MSRWDDFDNPLPSEKARMRRIKHSLEQDLLEVKVIPLDVLNQTQLAITQWAIQQFGPTNGPSVQLQVLKREVDEWIAEPTSLKEACDCFGLLMDCVKRMGFTMTDLLKETRRVYVQNIDRKWEPIDPPDSEGIVYYRHIEEAP